MESREIYSGARNAFLSVAIMLSSACAEIQYIGEGFKDMGRQGYSSIERTGENFADGFGNAGRRPPYERIREFANPVGDGFGVLAEPAFGQPAIDQRMLYQRRD